MLRETTFWLGGLVTIALGAALAGSLVWIGAGLDYADAWLGAALAVLFGAFFLYVSHDEHRSRREFLKESEDASSPRTGSGRG